DAEIGAVVKIHVEVVSAVEALHFEVWKYVRGPRVLELGAEGGRRVVHSAGREAAPGTLEIMQGQPKLLERARALGPGGGLSQLLHGRQEQADEDGDDGDDDEQLDQRERRPAVLGRFHDSIPVR